MAALVEGQGGGGNLVVGGGGTSGQKARSDPLQQLVAGHFIAGDNQHAPTAPAPDPVLGDRDSLGGAGTCRIDRRVRATCADVLSKLAVAHR